MTQSAKSARPNSPVEQALRKLARADKAEFLPGFFQAFPGGYGEGDRFMGVVVPDQRRVARQFSDLGLDELSELLASPWHECRLTALFILVAQFERNARPPLKKPAAGPGRRSPAAATEQRIVDFYMQHLNSVNNWDLVDSSAHKILGRYLLSRPGKRTMLKKLAGSQDLWRERVSVVATLPMIQHDQFDEILMLSERFLTHPHDLMHKAVGWMLREMGKRDIDLLRGFLGEHVAAMPRTMLRYAIEKMGNTERQQWMRR